MWRTYWAPPMPDTSLPPSADSYDVALALQPMVEALRAQGWEVNLGIEWRDGQCFSLAGRLPGTPPGEPGE